MKEYLLQRWKKRWRVIPAAGVLAMFSTLMHKGTTLANLLFWGVFVLVVILFPFHWGGEDWDEN
jgi:hypothetical protein